MKLSLNNNLPFTSVIAAYCGFIVDIPHVLIDTGSASTIFRVDILTTIKIFPLPSDILHTIRGVGGTEAVFIRKIDYLRVGTHSLRNFEIEVGGMDYGFEINGILGMDYMQQAGAIINLKELELDFMINGDT